MDPKIDALLHVLDSTRPATRFSKVGFGCVCFCTFLQGFNIYALNNAISISGEYFGLREDQMRILFVVHFANSYVSPILAALFADTLVGKYRAIFFAAAMRACASIVLIAIAITFHFSDSFTMQPTLKSALFGIYIFALVFLIISIEFLTAVINPFGMQQMNQERPAALTSATRWRFWCYDLGVVTATLSIGNLRITFGRYHALIEGATTAVTACLMLSLFILGKGQYNRRPTDDGKASFVTIWKIIKTKFCYRPRHSSLDDPMTFGEEVTDPEQIHRKLVLERLILRKLALTLALFACFGVAQVVFYKMIFMRVLGWCGKCNERHAFTAGFKTLFSYAPTLAFIPIMEYYKWRRGPRDQTSGASLPRFKSMGVGLMMAALAVLAAALFIHFESPHPNYNTFQSFWITPAFLFLGLSSLLVYLQALEFCYTESFKGLECFTTSLLSSLWMLLYTTITWTEVDWNKDEGAKNMEILYFALSGAMLGTLLLVFIPVCIWYNKVKVKIASATTDCPCEGYDSLSGSTIMAGTFLSNEETGERVRRPDWFDDSM